MCFIENETDVIKLFIDFFLVSLVHKQCKDLYKRVCAAVKKYTHSRSGVLTVLLSIAYWEHKF